MLKFLPCKTYRWPASQTDEHDSLHRSIMILIWIKKCQHKKEPALQTWKQKRVYILDEEPVLCFVLERFTIVVVIHGDVIDVIPWQDLRHNATIAQVPSRQTSRQLMRVMERDGEGRGGEGGWLGGDKLVEAGAGEKRGERKRGSGSGD